MPRYSGAVAARTIAERLIEEHFPNLKHDWLRILWDFTNRELKEHGIETHSVVRAVTGAAAFEILRHLDDAPDELPDGLFITELNEHLFAAMDERQQEACVFTCLDQMEASREMDDKTGKPKYRLAKSPPDWYGRNRVVDRYGLWWKGLKTAGQHMAPFVSQLGLDMTDGDEDEEGTGPDDDVPSEEEARRGLAVAARAVTQGKAEFKCRDCGGENKPGKRQITEWAAPDLCGRCHQNASRNGAGKANEAKANTAPVTGPEAAVPAGDR